LYFQYIAPDCHELKSTDEHSQSKRRVSNAMRYCGDGKCSKFAAYVCQLPYCDPTDQDWDDGETSYGTYANWGGDLSFPKWGVSKEIPIDTPRRANDDDPEPEEPSFRYRGNNYI